MSRASLCFCFSALGKKVHSLTLVNSFFSHAVSPHHPVVCVRLFHINHTSRAHTHTHTHSGCKECLRRPVTGSVTVFDIFTRVFFFLCVTVGGGLRFSSVPTLKDHSSRC